MNRITKFLKTKPAFLFILPVFFVLHGFTRNYNAVPVADALLLIFLYAGCAIIITGINWLLLKDIIKAALLAFFLMLYQLFFGNLQDVLKDLSPSGFISQYRFILPTSLLLFVVIIVWLKKRKTSLLKHSFYLNALLLIFILIDTGWLISKMAGTEKYMTINKIRNFQTIPDSCSKPDIYLLLVDQYAGNTALKDIFHFDNSPFLNELNHRGFYIAKHSTSNYDLTPFSMASLLSMNYLPPELALKTQLNLGYCYQVIRNSCIIKFLQENGYHFYNYSLFDFPGQPAHEYKAFLPYGIKLITLSTFTERLERDIRTAITEGKFKMESARMKIVYEHLHFNDSIFKFTANTAALKDSRPKFIYAHFMLPHFPYYFDSKGQPLPIEKITDMRRTNSVDYIEYLQYGNQKIIHLIDEILANSPSPPVIMLLSDHGARSFEKGKEHSNDFVNLNAVYLPNRNYTQFYDSITNVNQFRVFFNSYFDQKLPLLKDSTSDEKY